MPKKLWVMTVVLLVAGSLVCSAQGVVFSGDGGNGFDLYVVNPADMQIKRVTGPGSNEVMPAVSPNGKIAFVSDKTGGDSLYLMELSQPGKSWQNISIGMGAHANPSFNRQGDQVAVRYAPDPEAPLSATWIAVIDHASRNVKKVVDSSRFIIGGELVPVVDRPTWVDAGTIAFVLVEYSDIEAGRVSRSTIMSVDLASNEVKRLVGGESYFDEEGRARGYMATMPYASSDSGVEEILYVAVEGRVRRIPMIMSASGEDKRVISLNDQNFWGPLLVASETIVFGTLNDEGTRGISIRLPGEHSSFRQVPFQGEAVEPALFH